MLFVFQVELERAYIVHFKLHGQGVDKEPKGVLSIKDTGEVLVHKKMDYEEGPKILKVSTQSTYLKKIHCITALKFIQIQEWYIGIYFIAYCILIFTGFNCS